MTKPPEPPGRGHRPPHPARGPRMGGHPDVPDHPAPPRTSIARPSEPALPIHTLAGHLARCYQERHGLGSAGAATALRQTLAEDKALRDEAQARLAELDALAATVGGDLSKRCILSHTAREALREALAVDAKPQSG